MTLWWVESGWGRPDAACPRRAGAGGGGLRRRRRSGEPGRGRPGLRASPARGGACGRVGLVRERAESGAPRRARPAALMARSSGGPAREGRRGWARKLHGNEGVPFPGLVEADVGRRVALRVRQGRGGGAAAMAGGGELGSWRSGAVAALGRGARAGRAGRCRCARKRGLVPHEHGPRRASGRGTGRSGAAFRWRRAATAWAARTRSGGGRTRARRGERTSEPEATRIRARTRGVSVSEWCRGRLEHGSVSVLRE